MDEERYDGNMSGWDFLEENLGAGLLLNRRKKNQEETFGGYHNASNALESVDDG